MKTNDVLIEKYLMGTCTKAERKKVERLTKEDTNFAQELTLSRLAFASIAIGERERQKARLLALSRELKKAVPLYLRYRKHLQVAATFLILTALGITFYSTGLWIKATSKPLTHELFTDNFEPKKNAVGPLTRAVVTTLETTDLMASIAQQLGSGNCEAAEKHIAKLTKPLISDDLYIFLGSCYMEQNRPAEALKVLSKVSPDAMQADKASWYKILARLQSDDREAAIGQLCIYKRAAYVYKKLRIACMLKDLEHECE